MGELVPGDGFSSMGTRTGAIKLAMVVLRIVGADFLHCWVTDSISLECVEL